MSLTVTDVSHWFADTNRLFQHLTFTLDPGDLVALTGPSGSGKSTLLSLLAGWETPKEGTINHAQIHTVGWVFQNPHGVSERTAIDHVTLPLLAKGATRPQAEEQARRIMRQFGLEPVAQRKFKRLSGGEAQRLMLARAVALQPNLLLVDEPTAQLDRESSKTVSQVLHQLADHDMIVIVATHDALTAAACPKRIQLDRYAPA
jgi:ABC-type lipoprotein export system ATPase subunit